MDYDLAFGLVDLGWNEDFILCMRRNGSLVAFHRDDDDNDGFCDERLVKNVMLVMPYYIDFSL